MAVLGLLVFIGASTWHVWLMYRLRPHRSDISIHESPGRGASPFAQVNYMNPENYRPEGRRHVQWFYWSAVMQLVGAVVIGIGLIMGS